MPLEEFIIRVYCVVEESLPAILKERGVSRLRTRGFAPALTDAEVLTMELVGAFLGLSEDKALWAYFRRHWQAWFPRLGTRPTFVRQAANLWWVKARLYERWAGHLGAYDLEVHVVDGFPVPVCGFRRAHFSRIFKGEAAFGYCAAKDLAYYGFKGLLLVDARGVIVGVALAPAHVDERDALETLDGLERIAGLLLGDKGFLRPQLKADLAQRGVNLQTPVRANMQETRPKAFLGWMHIQRRRIETSLSQLSERFRIGANKARDLWHLIARLLRAVAAHTLCALLNHQDGRPLMRFEALVTE